MRWMIVLLAILLTIYYFMDEPEPRPVEETFIGDQLKPLRKAENFEQEYLKGDAEHKRKIEEELEKSGN